MLYAVPSAERMSSLAREQTKIAARQCNSATPTDDAEKAVRASGLFCRAHRDAISVWLKRMRPALFAAGSVVFAQGERGGALFVIVSGKVKETYRHTDGREAVLNILGPSEVFGVLTPFDNLPRTVTATALTEVRAVAIDRRQLLAWTVVCPEVIHQVMRLMARRVDVVTDCLVDFMCPDPTYRIARRLLVLAKRFGRRHADGVQVGHDMTLAELASFSGVDEHTAAVTLRDFKADGWIRIVDGEVLIVDAHGLAQVCAEVGCG
ncbi:Crp/Fnr family transcriptional regulator [Mycolicibacterium agri]|uniref:Crp/Fnr family transcriptional regulator n=1 Tax=Mycolicibacterium agri TaxID=36811 RepID=A0A2A7N618_MYCAG|nr:Crp/Fnr family transcriptional regulator [Mycolicibacterium agri]PEG39316.1 Crp/Fnr family transcriptional regulator [Mycolicibacterium agri]GFG51693.1 Crp/Fnr family transcriptional regulator [Mycolicibacterium agri]